jgi:hypothetical protein
MYLGISIWENYTQIDHVVMDRQRHGIVLDAQSFRAADCDNATCLMVVRVRETNNE